jgi:putative hemolysin
MLELAGYIVFMFLLLAAGYLVSVYANAIYIDPEEIKTLYPELTKRRRRQLIRLASDPRAFYQVAVLYRLSAALLQGALAIALGSFLAVHYSLPLALAILVVFAFTWAAVMVSYIYLPRRTFRALTKSRLLRFLYLVYLVYLVTYPVIAVSRRLSARRSTRPISEDEKDDIIERAIETLAETAGIATPIVEEDEKEMIQHIFQLDITEAVEIMTPRMEIVAFDEETTLDKVLEMVRKHKFSRYPVYRKNIDTIIGVVKVKYLFGALSEEPKRFRLSDYMRDPMLIGEHKKIDELLADFKRSRRQMAIVVDEFGGTAGLVTLEDILEEIVGEIEEEHEDGDRQLEHRPDGLLEASGVMSLWDLADELDLDVETEEFKTVGGVIYDALGTVPSPGATIYWQGCRFHVLEMDGQRIARVLITPPGKIG